MVEFGARLSLKDKMSATIKKNIEMQKKFTKQVKDTDSNLKKLGKRVAKPVIMLKDKASNGIKKVKDSLNSFKSTFNISLGILGAELITKTLQGLGALAGQVLGGGAMLEQQQISIEHFIGVNNKGANEAQIKGMADSYLKMLRENANATPFGTDEVISVGTRALNVASGDTAQAEKLLKVAEDMASLNPEKSLSDAIEAIADMKNGETERMKEFGFKISQEDINNAGGAMNVIEDQLAPYFEGGATKLAGSASGMVSTIKGNLSSFLSDTGLKIIEKATPMLEKLVNLTSKASPTLSKIGDAIANGFGKMMPIINWAIDNFPKIAEAFAPVGEKIKAVVAVVQSHMGLFRSIFETAIPAVKAVLSTAWNVVSPIIDIAITVFDNLLSCVETAFPTIQSIIESVWNVLSGIFDGIAGGISKINEAVSSMDIGGKLGGAINWIGGKLGFAYGKDRVPYNNYPAILHEGEKVLTRNQADQYERAQRSETVTVKETGSKAVGGVNIEKLADTVIIEKDADVDKVMAQMMAKFRKLVPNMA